MIIIQDNLKVISNGTLKYNALSCLEKQVQKYKQVYNKVSIISMQRYRL